MKHRRMMEQGARLNRQEQHYQVSYASAYQQAGGLLTYCYATDIQILLVMTTYIVARVSQTVK